MDKNFDFTTAKPVSQVPALQQLRKAYQDSQQDDLLSLFDSDVKQTLKMHNTPQDRMRLNTMIRVLFAVV